MNELNKKLVLYDENGEEYKFELKKIITVENYDYALLKPEGIQANDENGFYDNVYVFRIEFDDLGDSKLIDIDDEEEFNRVKNFWISLNEK